MGPIHLTSRPTLRDPILIAAFRGWNDGGSAGVWRGIGPVVEVDRYPQGAALGRAGLTRLPAERRLGPTEFPCVLEGPDGERGMVHFEHHIFGA